MSSCVFFFSSRRRHTRLQGDWSSDVCSSDLGDMPLGRDPFANFERMRREIDELFGDVFERSGFAPRRGFSPRVDVYYCGDPPKAVVNVDLAGVDIEEVGLEIRGRRLRISGER